MKVTPDGKFVAVALPASVAMFSIGSNGAPDPIPGSPFVSPAPPALDVNCASNLLFAPIENLSQGEVNVLSIASSGALTPISGSPFTFSGSVSLENVLSPDDQHLFVSNFPNSITSLSVASGGSLTEVSGSPFPTDLLRPIGMATNQAGTLLYVATGTNNIFGFNIDTNGALTPVPDSPFLIPGAVTFAQSLSVFPPKLCVQTVEIEIKPPASPPVPINPRAKGIIPVAILSTLSFNAVTQVDTNSLTFGHTGTEASLALCGVGGEDVNGDGLLDLVCHFNTAQTGLVAGDTTAFLKGQTVTGRKIQGSEAIRTVP